MKRAPLAGSLALILCSLGLAAASCSLETPPATNSGGSGSGGAPGGGASPGGSGGSAGAISPPGGMVGVSGSAGSGGTPGGAGGSAGSSGAGGVGGTGQPPLDDFAKAKNEFGFSFSDSYFLVACTEVQQHDCLTVQGACPDQDAPIFEDKGSTFVELFQMGGEMGKTYEVTIKVNGIVEGKYYQGGTRRRGNDFSDFNNPAGTDSWHIGGSAIPSSYNVFKITVLEPDKATEVEHYYLNSFPQASGLESHQTVPIGYEATFDVPGQGWIRYLNQDSNCRAINNCGPGDNGATCPSARNVPNEPGLQAPAMYSGKMTASMNVVNGAQQPFHAQMVHVTVTDVKLKP